MKFFIPTIGTSIVLKQDWHFKLNGYDYRNRILWQALVSSEPFSRREEGEGVVMLPAGTELTVSRIYIRNGKSQYDSITFLAKNFLDINGKKVRSARFWVKLEDANEIEYELNN